AYGTGAGFTGDEHHGAHHDADADADGCVCAHTAYGVEPTAAAVNGPGGGTPMGSSDFPSAGNKGGTHQPNREPDDVAFIDPLDYNAATGTNQSQSVRWIARVTAHEAGHTFGLVHVLSSPDVELMSYNNPVGSDPTRFLNKTFNVTDLNFDQKTRSNYHEPKIQPQWLNYTNAYGFPIPTVSNITTQNSFTYLKAALGARSTAYDFAN